MRTIKVAAGLSLALAVCGSAQVENEKTEEDIPRKRLLASKVFEELDKNGDGSIDEVEFQGVIRRRGERRRIIGLEREDKDGKGEAEGIARRVRFLSFSLSALKDVILKGYDLDEDSQLDEVERQAAISGLLALANSTNSPNGGKTKSSATDETIELMMKLVSGTRGGASLFQLLDGSENSSAIAPSPEKLDAATNRAEESKLEKATEIRRGPRRQERREAMQKRFDRDGSGDLDESEKAEMREAFDKRRAERRLEAE